MSTPRPTAFGSYGHGWRQLKKYFLYLLLVGLINIVADSLGGGWGSYGPEAGPPVFLQLLVTAYSLLIMPVIGFGADLLYLRFMRDEQADVREIFDGFRTNYLNIVLANLLWVAIIGIGLVLLIVPGIVFLCRLAFVPYLVMDRRLDPVAAVEKSWQMTRGHGWRIFGMFLLAIPLFIVGILLLGVGVIPAFILVQCAFASLYHAVDLEEQKRLDENGSPA